MDVLDEFRQFVKISPLARESQQIDRQLEAFAETMNGHVKHTRFPDRDSVVIFCYSCVMLSTDFHVAAARNPATHIPMTLEMWAAQVQSMVPLEMSELSQVYDSIKKERI